MKKGLTAGSGTFINVRMEKTATERTVSTRAAYFFYYRAVAAA